MRAGVVAVRGWTTLLDVLGLGLVVAGVALVSVPVAMMVAGGAFLLVSWRVERR